MSTLKVTNIQDTAGANSRTTAQLYSGSAKAWVNYNATGTIGTNQTIRASFNVSSVFKNTTADYTVNITNALPDANYITLCTIEDAKTSTPFLKINSAVYTTTQIGLFCGGNGGSSDPTICCVAVFR